MSETERCSWCGAEKVEIGSCYADFACGSWRARNDKMWFRGEKCKTPQQPALNGVEFEMRIGEYGDPADVMSHSLPRCGDIVEWQLKTWRVTHVRHDVVGTGEKMLKPLVVVCPISEEVGSE